MSPNRDPNHNLGGGFSTHMYDALDAIMCDRREWVPTYPGYNWNTLTALRRRGLIALQVVNGETCCRITEAGKAAIA